MWYIQNAFFKKCTKNCKICDQKRCRNYGQQKTTTYKKTIKSDRSIEHIATNDGSNTLFSTDFDQHYHSTKEGALTESLSKHIIPAFTYHKNKKELNILDICFGLGYNTLATLYYIQKNNLDIKVNIYSPEFDKELLHSLKNFKYPKEFQPFNHIITSLANDFSYKDNNISIKIFNGDARKYIKTLQNIDIVYQDAFSSEVNHFLWTVEYFKDIKNTLNHDAILTTYSIATPIRLSMYENGFTIYEHKPDTSNRITVALNKIQKDTQFKYIDMELKKQRNTTAKALFDK